MKLSNQKVGALFILSGTALFGLYGVFSRLIKLGFNTFSQTFIIGFIAAITILVVFKYRRYSWKKIQRGDMLWFVLWGTSGALVTALMFLSFNNIAIATSYFMFYSMMVVAGIIFGKIFFLEEFNILKFMSLSLSIIGLVFVFYSETGPAFIKYEMFALMGGILAGFWNTASKKISSNYASTQMMLINSSFMIIVGILGMIIMKEPIPLSIPIEAWGYIILYAILELVAAILIILGFKHLEAQKASLLMPIEVVFAAIFGFIFYKEIPTILVLIGGLLIMIGAIMPNIKNTSNK